MLRQVFNKLNTYLSQLKAVHGKLLANHQSKHNVLADMLSSSIRYGASPNNYYNFRFFELNAKKRKTYLTNRHSSKLIRKYNSKEHVKYFNDKSVFMELFKQFTKREWIPLKGLDFDGFCSFLKNKERFVVKPIVGSQGIGVQKMEVSQDVPLTALFQNLKNQYRDNGLLEEWITQHPSMAAIFPDSVNCIRIITILDDMKFYPIVANITFGVGDNQIANASFGGIVVEVDIDSGVVISDGAKFDTDRNPRHPNSGKPFKGFQIPFWKETLAMLEEASKVVPEVGYIGWDVAIAPDGPVIIEGNTTPGYTYFQIPSILPNQVGTFSKYKEFLS